MARDTRPLETLYSVKDAAKKLGGVSKFTIYEWMSRGVLERTRVGGRVMVRESSLLKLLQQGNKREPNATPHASRISRTSTFT